MSRPDDDVAPHPDDVTAPQPEDDPARIAGDPAARAPEEDEAARLATEAEAPARPAAEGEAPARPAAEGEAPARPAASVPAGAPSGRARASWRRTTLRLLVGLLALAAAALLILWLPPSRDVKTVAETAVLEYELAREATWPKGATLGLPLSPADEHMLAVTLRTHVARHAAGTALESFDAAAAAAAFAAAAAGDLVHAVIRWKGEVVYFDFVRHSLPDGVIVRAGVAKAQRVGRVDALHQRVFARRWVWNEDVEIYRVHAAPDRRSVEGRRGRALGLLRRRRHERRGGAAPGLSEWLPRPTPPAGATRTPA